MLSTLVGAVLGDLPGLRRTQTYGGFAGSSDEDMRGARRLLSRESLTLAALWMLLSLLMRWAWPLPHDVWYLFSLFGLGRCIQLGNHLERRRLWRQAG